MSNEITCQDCGASFLFSDKAQAFYHHQNWEPPIRCKCCQTKKKAYRSSPLFGIHEAMFQSKPAKRGHCRVHYAPYIVGGFR